MLTVVKNQFKVSFLSIKYNIMREMINIKTFLFSVFLMFISNASFLVQWLIIISINSGVNITMKEVLMVWGFAAASYGLFGVLFDGIESLPSYIINGSLDAYLVQPKNILLAVASSKSRISAVGDLLYGIVVLLIVSPSVKTFLLVLLFSILGSVIYASFLTIINSLVFFSIEFRGISDVMSRIPMSFSTYPESIFTGFIRILFYTLFPIAYIVYLPVRYMFTNNWLILLVLVLFALLITLLAFFIFNRGLKRYSSTNLMNARI